MKANGTSLFIALKKGDMWDTPSFIGDAVSPPHSSDIESRLGPDHRTLYYASTREVPI